MKEMKTLIVSDNQYELVDAKSRERLDIIDSQVKDFVTESYIENYVESSVDNAITGIESHLVGKETEQGGVVFNDYERNTAASKSVAFGYL